jgi:hypothetical protein
MYDTNPAPAGCDSDAAGIPYHLANRPDFAAIAFGRASVHNTDRPLVEEPS